MHSNCSDYACPCHFAVPKLVEEVRRLRELVAHCWIHHGSDFQNCGYEQMTTEQKTLFRGIMEQKS